MSIKSVLFFLVAICIATSANAQLPQFPPLPFPFPFPFPNPFHPSPGMPGFPNPFHPSPGMPGFPNPFQPSPGMPGVPNPFQPSPGMPGVPNPFQPSPGMPGIPNMSKCWSTLMDIPGCIAEIKQSLMTGKFGNIGPACCKALLDAEANCTANLPFNQFFPPMLKQQCSRNAGAPTVL